MKRFSMFLAIAVLAGCASLGLEAPKSPREQLAYAYSQLAGARNSVATALQLKTISADQAQRAQDIANQVRVGLDAAAGASVGCPPSGQITGLAPNPKIGIGEALVVVQLIKCDPKTTLIDQLALANKVLLMLVQYLQAQGVKTADSPPASELALLLAA